MWTVFCYGEKFFDKKDVYKFFFKKSAQRFVNEQLNFDIENGCGFEAYRVDKGRSEYDFFTVSNRYEKRFIKRWI